MRYLSELIGTTESREDFMAAIIDAIKNDGYDCIDEFETWVGDIGYFGFKKNGINIGNIVVKDEGEDLYFKSIIFCFDIKAKKLDDIIEAEYFYENKGWHCKEDKSHIGGDKEDVFNDIGNNGCIAKTENMLILVFDEAENDPYADIEDDITFNEVELLEIYERYCYFC